MVVIGQYQGGASLYDCRWSRQLQKMLSFYEACTQSTPASQHPNVLHRKTRRHSLKICRGVCYSSLMDDGAIRSKTIGLGSVNSFQLECLSVFRPKCSKITFQKTELKEVSGSRNGTFQRGSAWNPVRKFCFRRQRSYKNSSVVTFLRPSAFVI